MSPPYKENSQGKLTIKVSMWVTELLRLAQSDAVNDGGMVEGVGKHGILWRQHGLEETGVGVETRAV